MKLNLRAFALSAAVFWGLALLADGAGKQAPAGVRCRASRHLVRRAL